MDDKDKENAPSSFGACIFEQRKWLETQEQLEKFNKITTEATKFAISYLERERKRGYIL
ncbi:MAG: hypothetical protein KAX49_15255 [Halanaerobiales bacterium]|nr:hypothetical protein [Halanaerobiales bacterium]